VEGVKAGFSRPSSGAESLPNFGHELFKRPAVDHHCHFTLNTDFTDLTANEQKMLSLVVDHEPTKVVLELRLSCLRDSRVCSSFNGVNFRNLNAHGETVEDQAGGRAHW